MKSDDKLLLSHPYQLLLAGATAGTVTRFVLQPLDVLKVRFQLQTASKMEEKKYISIPQAVRTIAKEEGLQGLWKGHIPAQYLSILYGSVQFSVHEYSIQYLKSNNPKTYFQYEHLINITGGFISGILATVISYPFDTLRTHLIFQGEPKIYNGMFDAAKKIYIKDGPSGFSKGLMSACLSAGPLSGLIFYFHGIFSNLWFIISETNFDPSQQHDLPVSGNLLIGLLAGLCAKTVVYPLDLMKKRLQIQNFNMNEGLMGLFKGFVPTALKASTATSLYFTIFDLGTKLIYYLHHSER